MTGLSAIRPRSEAALATGGSRRKPDISILAVSLLTFAVCCGAWAWFATVFPETAWDFTEFYIAGRVPITSLYDQDVFHEYGDRLTPHAVDYYPPYVRPAIFSLPLRALMWLPYWPAYAVFACLQFACFLGALYLLRKRFAVPIELLAGFGLFYPAMMGIITGQDSNAVALLLAAGLVLLLDHKDRAAGIVLALCLYKFNLMLLLPVLLLIKRRYEAFRWFCGAAALLAAGSTLVSPPGQYLTLLRNISRYTIGFSPGRMIGLRALAYGLGEPALYYLFAALAVLGSIWAMKRLAMPQAFCVAILGALLCSYHVNWYDGAVLLVPLMLAFGSTAPWPKLAAAPLLFAFPVWAAFPKVIAALLLLLLAAFASTESNALRAESS